MKKRNLAKFYYYYKMYKICDQDYLGKIFNLHALVTKQAY